MKTKRFSLLLHRPRHICHKMKRWSVKRRGTIHSLFQNVSFFFLCRKPEVSRDSRPADDVIRICKKMIVSNRKDFRYSCTDKRSSLVIKHGLTWVDTTTILINKDFTYNDFIYNINKFDACFYLVLKVNSCISVKSLISNVIIRNVTHIECYKQGHY